MLTFDEIVALQLGKQIAKADVEEALYELAAAELSSKQFVPGLMAKSYAETGGDDKAAAARYLKLRVDQLQAHVRAAVALAREEAERERTDNLRNARELTAEEWRQRTRDEHEQASRWFPAWAFVAVVLVVALLALAKLLSK